MSGDIMFAVVVIATMLYSVWIISGQRRTIDKLTDKILGIQPVKAKQEIKEDDVSPKEDEPKSWFDH